MSAVANNKKKGTQSRMRLFNLSRYVREYYNADGEEVTPRGIMISGYTYDEEGNKQFCNIWVDKDYSIKKRPDGAYTLMLKMVEKEVKE